MISIYLGLACLFLSIFGPEAAHLEITAPDELLLLRYSAEQSKDTQQCLDTDLECSSCSKLAMKIDTCLGPMTVDIECNTTRGEYCNKYLRRCSDRKSYCSLGGEFVCHEEGRFPHPFECDVYYECTLTGNGALVATEYSCPSGALYNARTYQCEERENGTKCEEYPVPECPDSECLDIYPLPQNPNIFYTCENGIPQLYKCTEGEDYFYDPAQFQCVKNESVPITTTTEPPTKPPSEDCGPIVWDPVPYTCDWYYNCTQMPSPRWTFCGTGYYFDRMAKSCMKGQCPYGDEIDDMCNSMPDGIYPIPHHCNSRYICSGGKWTAITSCRAGSYFDRELLECVPGSCPYTDL